jgi:hypothetical protein
MDEWRQESFEKLSCVYESIKLDPFLGRFANYLDLLERGLRKQALKEVELFLNEASTWSTFDRRAVVSRLCRIDASSSMGHAFVPFSIKDRLIEPVIGEWIDEEPENPEPLRWTGNLDDLEKSLELENGCDATRYRYIQKAMNYIAYVTHELPQGYLGNASDDLKLLEKVDNEICKLADDSERVRYLDFAREERSKIERL